MGDVNKEKWLYLALFIDVGEGEGGIKPENTVLFENLWLPYPYVAHMVKNVSTQSNRVTPIAA